tara:strand:+ start:160 stop:273 length:114 start_codon:yes stop_codon:yes gene_type:complete
VYEYACMFESEKKVDIRMVVICDACDFIEYDKKIRAV